MIIIWVFLILIVVLIGLSIRIVHQQKIGIVETMGKFTTTVTPSQLEGFEPRLATRLAGGLVLELGAPDREARVQEVVRLLGALANDADLVDYLAARPAVTLRDTQQLVQRLLAAAE